MSTCLAYEYGLGEHGYKREDDSEASLNEKLMLGTALFPGMFQ